MKKNCNPTTVIKIRPEKEEGRKKEEEGRGRRRKKFKREDVSFDMTLIFEWWSRQKELHTKRIIFYLKMVQQHDEASYP